MPLVIFTVLPLRMPITSWSEATQFTFPENITDIFSGNDTVVDSPAFAPIENNPHCLTTQSKEIYTKSLNISGVIFVPCYLKIITMHSIALGMDTCCWISSAIGINNNCHTFFLECNWKVDSISISCCNVVPICSMSPLFSDGTKLSS